MKNKEKNIADLAKKTVDIYLDICSEAGEEVQYEPDGMIWKYSGTHWHPIEDRVIHNQLYNVIKKFIPEGEQHYSSIKNQAIDLLRAETGGNAPLLDLNSPPPSVINCTNGELWINDKG